MPGLNNRIGLSLLRILLGVYLWEFYAKPVSGSLHSAVVNEYRNRQYDKSHELLQRAYEIDPNDTSVLTLMGWIYLKMGQPAEAVKKFGRGRRPRCGQTWNRDNPSRTPCHRGQVRSRCHRIP